MLGSGSNTIESWKDFLPYILFVGADGLPDHNTNHISNFLSMMALFLLGDMDRLVVIRVYPSLSFQNTAEREMSFLNISLSNLALKIDEDAPD